MERQIDIYEVARKAGVSKSTVSRVLNGLSASEAAREKVMYAIEELKYRPNISARSLRNNSSNLVGILIPQELTHETISSNINSGKIKGIVKKVKELGYDVLIFIEDTMDFERLRTIIMEKGLSGIILMDRVSPEVLENFSRFSIPHVAVNWFDAKIKDLCYVKTDLAKATTMALDVLTQKGYTDIGLLYWEDDIISCAFISYMDSKGLNHEKSIWKTDINQSMQEIVQILEQHPKRAYLCFSYYTSMKILDYCRKKGIRLPQDIALISYEFFEFFDYLYPKLSGLQQQVEKMGEMAVEKLVALINGEENVMSELIDPVFVMRDSC